MSDLVEHLRQAQIVHLSPRQIGHMRHEAADEIERLRHELEIALRRFKTIRSAGNITDDVGARALRLGIADLEAALGQKEAGDAND